MSRPSLARPIALAVVALVVLLALRRVSTARALAIWLLVVATLVLFRVARDVRGRDTAGATRRFEAALRGGPPRSAVPVELLRMRRELEVGVASGTHAHRRLLPLLRSAAAARLASGHGVDLARSPERAQALLGDDVWELLRPDRPAPADRNAPGVPRAAIVAVIEKVESL